MTTVTSHQPGSFCWIELSTSDASTARTFYSELFGWESEDVPGDHGVYTIFRHGGRDAAALFEDRDAPAQWTSYVAVQSADDAVAKLTRLGGRVVAGPFDVMDLGRMAYVADPQQARFAVWEAKKHAGLGVRDETNSLCWNELHTRDLTGARSFYVSLFGWRVKESDEYAEWHVGAHAIGGMLQSHAPPDVPPFWLPYFSVADCDVAVDRARSRGAGVVVKPTDIPNVGRFAVLTSPDGASFAVICLAA